MTANKIATFVGSVPEEDGRYGESCRSGADLAFVHGELMAQVRGGGFGII